MGSPSCVGLPRIPNVSRSEYSNGSGSKATTSGYSVGSNFCTDTIGTEELYILEPVKNNNTTTRYPDSEATHHVCKEKSALNTFTLYPGKIPLLMGDGTHVSLCG